jgi:hypothetical protein
MKRAALLFLVLIFLTPGSVSAKATGVWFLGFRMAPAPQGGNLVTSLAQEAKPPTALSNFKDFADALKSIAEIVGLAVGGVWTWRLFIKNRQDYPRAKVAHTISHRVLPDGKRLLRVTANIENIGPVILRIDEGFIWVQQILPLPPEFAKDVAAGKDPIKANRIEYDWPLIAERKWKWKESPREVEPGEEDNIPFDFVIDAEASLVEIYSYFKNERKTSREIGWDETTVYDFDEGKSLFVGNRGKVTIEELGQASPKATPPWKSGLG